MRLPALFLASLGIAAMDAGFAAPPVAPGDASPLAAPWNGPFGGVPPFDRVTPGDLAAAL